MHTLHLKALGFDSHGRFVNILKYCWATALKTSYLNMKYIKAHFKRVKQDHSPGM